METRLVGPLDRDGMGGSDLFAWRLCSNRRLSGASLSRRRHHTWHGTTTSRGMVEARLVSTGCLLFADLSRYIVDVSIGNVTEAGDRHDRCLRDGCTMGSFRWPLRSGMECAQRLAGQNDWTSQNDGTSWLSRSAPVRPVGNVRRHPLAPRLVRRLDHGGVQVAAGAVPRPAAVIFGRQFLASSRSSP